MIWFEPSSPEHSTRTCSSELQEETTEQKIFMCFSMIISVYIWTGSERIRWNASFATCGVCLLLELQNLPHFTKDELRAISTTLSNLDWSSTQTMRFLIPHLFWDLPLRKFQKEVKEVNEKEARWGKINIKCSVYQTHTCIFYIPVCKHRCFHPHLLVREKLIR